MKQGAVVAAPEETAAAARTAEPLNPAPATGVRGWLRNPWGQPRGLALITGLYLAWALVPVAVAILFSFNDGRSRSVWQGFSTRWWWGDPNLSVFHNAEYTGALRHSLVLAALDMAIATPLGTALALGLTRWRGRGSGSANTLMLFPLVTPELVMAVSLLLVLTQLGAAPFSLVHLGTTAQIIGQVTFSVSYVVVIVRGRLLAIGAEYEEAAQDLGATRLDALRLALLPLLLPALFAGAMVVFALSIDDFVVTQYMSSNSSTTTMPMELYSNARGGTTTPALNALASIMVFVTVLAVAFAVLVDRIFGRRRGGAGGLGSVAGMEM